MIAEELQEEAAEENCSCVQRPRRKKKDSFMENDKPQFMLVSENGGYCLWGG